MRKGWLIVTALFIVIVIGLIALIAIPSPKTSAPSVTTATTSISDLITVDSPTSGATIASPLTITGKARGTFYFEASFPVKLKDASGNVIAQGPAQAQGDWMTTDFVPFTATLTFPAQPAGSTGVLELANDNPSGDPANQKELDIPVQF